MDGVLVVDKPEGWTSHDVVGRVRRLAGTKKVGHLGTLDPMATGVLPLVIGRATRLAKFFGRDEKIYEGVIRFGQSTDTYDRQGKPTSDLAEFELNREQVDAALGQFRGTFDQMPPQVSAKKVDGVAAYKMARKNIPVVLRAVSVTVSKLDLLDFDGRDAFVRIVCSSGTYVRSIAHELGQLLGCGGMLQSLRRTASGGFGIEASRTLEQLAELSVEKRMGEALVGASDLLPEFPCESVDDITIGQIRQGRDFRVSPFRTRDGKYVKAVASDGELIAIGEARLPNVYHPVLVFHAHE